MVLGRARPYLLSIAVLHCCLPVYFRMLLRWSCISMLRTMNLSQLGTSAERPCCQLLRWRAPD